MVTLKSLLNPHRELIKVCKEVKIILENCVDEHLYLSNYLLYPENAEEKMNFKIMNRNLNDVEYDSQNYVNTQDFRKMVVEELQVYWADKLDLL